MKSVAFHNLGCKVNAYETDVMQQTLQERGYKTVPFDEKADIYIVNTCSVTNMADRKSRQMLHQAKKRNPEAVVIAAGCYVQTKEEEASLDESIDLLIGNNKKKDLVEIIETFLSQKEPSKTLSHTTVIDINHTDIFEEMKLDDTAEHTRAYIKIQDGCNQFCSYCIIPYARGRVRSRKETNILDEIRGLVEKGYKEVVLTGIHISSYGVDQSRENSLISLLEKIQEIQGLQRIRLGSLEPRIITIDFVQRIKKLDKICPHFHLSLQSGCDATLKRMNRQYTASEYYEKVKLIRSYFDKPAITTDVIVGFPGESEEEFEITKQFLEKVEFYEMHIFKYSKRQGTRAAKMLDQVADEDKAKRSELLLQIEQKQSQDFRTHYQEKEVEVLWEEPKEIDGQTYQIGHTREYIKAAVLAEQNLVNQISRGVLTRELADGIILFKE